MELTLEAGDVALLRGPSASGKSLLLRSLCGLDRADEGHVAFRGTPMEGRALPELRSHVLYVQQAPVLVPGTVADNIELPRSFAVHADRPSPIEPARGLFGALGKGPAFLDQRSGLLSGGEGQLVALVRALLLEPEVLLLDEPTAHLDPATTAKVERLVLDWVEEGDRAVLWTSHDPQQAARIRRGPMLDLGVDA